MSSPQPQDDAIAMLRERTNHDAAPAATDLRGPAVIVDGSVIAGFTFTGPFATIDEAAEWHRTRRLAGVIGLPAAAIALLEKPRQEVFDE